MQAPNPPPSNKEGDSITPGIVADGREVTPSFQRRVDSQDLPIQIPEKPIIDGDEIMDDKSVPFTIYDNDNVFIGLKYRRRIIATFMVVILVMFTGGGYIVSWVFKDRDISPDPLTAISSDKLQGITEQQTGETNELAVNSPLHINNRLIVAPSAPPTTSPSQAGEIYFNADTKQFVYYDGDSYQTVVNGQDLSQLSSVGRANTGIGLNLVAGVLNNGGVLSIQGNSGNISFLAGNGISLNGLTVTNTGVTSVTGTASQIVVSAATGSITVSLPQDIALTSNVTFNQVTLGLNGSNTGRVVFRGGTSNSVTLQAPASPTSGLTFTLPITDGANGECLRTNGFGALSFSACMGGGTFINNGITLQTGNFAIQSADATYTGAVIRAATSQSADLFQLQNSNGTVLASFSKDGRLNFSGDTSLYRSGVNSLSSAGSLTLGGSLTAVGSLNVIRVSGTTSILNGKVSGDAFNRYQVTADGTTEWGDGINATDTSLYRSAAGTLTFQSSTTTSATLQAANGTGADADGQSFNLVGGAGTGMGNGGDINLRVAAPTNTADNTFFNGTGAKTNSVTVNSSYMFWANDNTGAIGRANLDGSGMTSGFISTGSPHVRFKAVTNENYVYWVGPDNIIGRANVDGSGVNNSFITITAGTNIGGLGLDGTYIYWIGYSNGKIGRANLDGSGVNENFITGIGAGGSGNLAITGSYIYWANGSADVIGRANLDGSGANTSFITGAINPDTVSVDSSHVYWGNRGNTIGRANLDGSSMNNSFISLTGFNGSSVANNGLYLYYSLYSVNSGSVGRLSLGSTSSNAHLTVASLSGSNGAALFKNAVDSTTAFQIQNAAGTSNLFVADTANTRIGLGAAPATSLLTIGTNTTTASGGITFGTDTNLYRSGADVLRTDDTLSVAGTFYLYNSVSSNNQASISNGGANTTFSHLNNTPAGRLILMSKGSTTSGIRLTVGSAGNIEFFADTTSVGKITSAGQLQLPIQGSGAGLLIGDDVNLYRETANYLRTDNNFKAIGGVYSGADIMARQGSANRVTIGQVGPASQAGIRLSSSEDTLLYRSAAGALMVQGANTATDSTLIVKGLGTQVADLFQLQNSSGTVLTSFDKDGRLVFGTDTNIYRSAAGRLKTDGQLEINAGATPGVDTRYIEVSNTSNSRRIGLGLFADGTVGVISNDRLYLQGNTSTSGVAIRPSSTGSQFNFSNINSQNGQLSISGSGSILTLQQASANQKVRLSDGVVLEFGSAGDTNIYRSAADTLKTDDNLIVASNFTANGTALFQKSSNSTTAFQIQNSAGAGVFTADTINSIIKLGDATNTDLTAWQTNANALPGARKTAASVTANGYVYVLGGNDGTTAQSTVYYAKLNADGSTSSWTTNPNNLPAVRQNLTAATANGYVYAIGGYDGTNTKNTVYYAKLNADGSTSSWTTTTLPANRSLASAVTANGYLYVVSGEDDTNGLQSVLYAKLNADGTLGAWTTDTNIPSITDAAAAVVLNGYLYVVGGFSGGTYSHDILYAKLNPLDGSIGSWTTVNQGGLTLPADIDYHTVTAMNGTIYVFGGWDGSTVQDKVYYTKPSSTNGSINGWSTSANNLPDARRQHTTVTANGYVYVLGGDNSGAKSTIYYSSIQRVQIAGVLDLVGPGSGNLAESGSGGSLTAGNTDILGQLAVRESTNIQQNLSVGGNFLVGGSVLFKNATDTTTAFQVQNAAGTTLLLADTSNMIINVMGDTTAFASLALTNAHFRSVQTNAPTIATPTNCGTSPAASIKADSTDSAGAFSVTAGSGSPSTCDTTITFNKTYGAAPKSILVVAQSQDGGTGTAAARQIYVSSTTATNFTVKMNSTPATSEVDWYYYWVVE